MTVVLGLGVLAMFVCAMLVRSAPKRTVVLGWLVVHGWRWLASVAVVQRWLVVHGWRRPRLLLMRLPVRVPSYASAAAADAAAASTVQSSDVEQRWLVVHGWRWLALMQWRCVVQGWRWLAMFAVCRPSRSPSP